MFWTGFFTGTGIMLIAVAVFVAWWIGWMDKLFKKIMKNG